MNNIRTSVEGNEIVIRVTASERLGPSKSGKTMLVANSGGFAVIEGSGGLKLSLNVIAPK